LRVLATHAHEQQSTSLWQIHLKDSFQFIHGDWLNEMGIHSRVLRTLSVCRLSVSGESDNQQVIHLQIATYATRNFVPVDIW